MKRVGHAAAICLLCVSAVFCGATDGPLPAKDAPAAVAQMPAARDKVLYDALVAVASPGGEQLPEPVAVGPDWQSFAVGPLALRTPPGWTLQERTGAADDRIQGVGVLAPDGNLYVELRLIRDAESGSRTAMVHAIHDYRESARRFANGIVLGFQPRVVDGAAGHVEIMDVAGNADSAGANASLRTITWHGRWAVDGTIQAAEFTARFMRDRFVELAPRVSSLLAGITVGRRDESVVPNPIRPWMFLAGLIGLSAAAWMLARARRIRHFIRAIETAATVPANSSSRVLVKVVGQAHPGGTLPEGVPAPAWAWVAKDIATTSHSGSRTGEMRSRSPIVLRDATGTCAIDPQTAEVVPQGAEHACKETGNYDSECIDTEFIRTGCDVFAIGRLGDRTPMAGADSAVARKLLPGGPGVLLVSGRSEAETLAVFRARRRQCLYAAILCVVVPSVAIAFGLATAWQSMNRLY